jgi:hypothetical protein
MYDDESTVSIYLDGKKKTHREEQRENDACTHKKEEVVGRHTTRARRDLVKNCRESLFKRPGPTREEKRRRRRRCTTVFYHLFATCV